MHHVLEIIMFVVCSRGLKHTIYISDLVEYRSSHVEWCVECQIFSLLPFNLLLPLLPQLPPGTSPLSSVFYFLTSLFCFTDFPFKYDIVNHVTLI